jgi:hypothetical protein
LSVQPTLERGRGWSCFEVEDQEIVACRILISLLGEKPKIIDGFNVLQLTRR